MSKSIIILGKRSFFSKELNKLIGDSKVVNISDFLKIKKKNYILIINYSFPSKFLNNNRNLYLFQKIYLNEFDKIFSHILLYPPAKIIFSSSSSIYYYSKYLKKFNLENYSKILNIIFKKFVEKKLINIGRILNIKILICRLFNLYGNNDKFSFISNIKNNKKIFVKNDGYSKRDYIHVKDASKIYLFLINKNFQGTVDIGTGKNISIRNIERKINSKKIFFYSKNQDIIKASKANITKISYYFKFNKLNDVIEFINNKPK